MVTLTVLDNMLFWFFVFVFAIEWWGYSGKGKLSDLFKESRSSFSNVRTFLFRVQYDFLEEYLLQFFAFWKILLDSLFSVIFLFFISTKLFTKYFLLSNLLNAILTIVLIFILEFVVISFWLNARTGRFYDVLNLFSELKKSNFKYAKLVYSTAITSSLLILVYSLMFSGIYSFFNESSIIIFVNDKDLPPFNFFEISVTLAIGFMIAIEFERYLKRTYEKLQPVKNKLDKLLKKYPKAFESKANFESEYVSIKDSLPTNEGAILETFSSLEEFFNFVSAPKYYAGFAVFFLIFLEFGQSVQVEGELNLNLSLVVFLFAIYIFVSFNNFVKVIRKFLEK